jgi:hypothetical protein
MGSGCDDRGVPEHSTLVIEDGVIPRRVRRPIDLLRVVLSVGLIALILTLAYFASHTTSGLQHDVSTGARRLPAVLVLVVNAVSVLGVLLLPISTTVDLLLRRRSRQLLEAVLALVFVVLAVSGVARLILLYGSNAILEALTGSDNRTGRPLDALLAGLLAFITVARLMDRPRWSAFGALVVIGLFIGSVVNGGTTVAALSLSMLAGWGVGLAVRYTLGTPTTRPSGHEIAAALERTGYPVTVLRAARETDRGRAYVATSRSGEALEVRVLDRDLEGAGIANTLWRMLRLRTVIGLDAFSMRRTRTNGPALLRDTSCRRPNSTPAGRQRDRARLRAAGPRKTRRHPIPGSHGDRRQRSGTCLAWCAHAARTPHRTSTTPGRQPHPH